MYTETSKYVHFFYDLTFVQSANVLLDWNEQLEGFHNIVISDFGTSKNVQQSLAKTLTGTPEWISPETYRTYYLNKETMHPQRYDGKKADSKFYCY